MMAAVDLQNPDGSPIPSSTRAGYAVFQRALTRGAWLRPLGNTMYFFPPLITQPAIIDEMVQILHAAIDEALM